MRFKVPQGMIFQVENTLYNWFLYAFFWHTYGANHSNEEHVRDLWSVKNYPLSRPHLFKNLPSLSIPKQARVSPVISYHPSLKETELNLLKTVYPGIEFVKSSGIVENPHELNTLSRKCETYYLYDLVGAFDAEGIVVHDVGGNAIYGASHQLTSVHYGSIVSDLKDGGRKTWESATLERMVRANQIKPSTRVRFDYATADTRYRCRMGVNLCPKKCKVAFEIHVYDISMEDRLRYFDSKEIEIAHQICFFHPMILLQKSGILYPAGVAYTRKIINGEERILFSFLNDPSIAYEHKYLTYIAPFVSNVVQTSKGRVYIIERTSPRINQYHITYTLVSSIEQIECFQTVTSFYDTDMEDYTMVVAYEKLHEYYLPSDSHEQFHKNHILVPTDLYENAIRTASCIHKTDRTTIPPQWESTVFFNIAVSTI